MHSTFLIFWLAVYAGLILLRLFPQSAATQAAFTWFGPAPQKGEAWARFQLRWAAYSFWWLAQVAVVLCIAAVVADYRDTQDDLWFQGLAFACGLGGAMAALATLWFLLTALKARIVGPNPTVEPEQHVV
jgi:hypothetical protein